MVLSVTEKAFLADSLKADPVIRPDGREAYQNRPIELFVNFLPSSNGSSRIIASDGSECIVSVKSKVVDHTLEDELIEVDVDIVGYRDGSLLVESTSSFLKKALRLGETVERKSLQLTTKYSFKLYIDILVISCNSNPTSLISFGMYTALKSTYLPKLISSYDDLQVEELPTFHDYDLVKLEIDPPVVFLLAIVGDNIILDPAANECEVANNGLLLTWSNGKIVSPVRTIALNDTHLEGFDQNIIKLAYEMVTQYAPEIVRALDQ